MDAKTKIAELLADYMETGVSECDLEIYADPIVDNVYAVRFSVDEVADVENGPHADDCGWSQDFLIDTTLSSYCIDEVEYKTWPPESCS